MTTFKDLGLSPLVLEALNDIGFEQPTPVQARVIPHLISSDKDLIALAQTGTGKTAAFSLPVIQKLDLDNNNVQVLILCPTRELALQVCTEIDRFTKYLKKAKALAVYGGESMEKQVSGLRKNPQIIVGTPGRINDMIKRRFLDVSNLRWLILDEADEMLNMGFKEELDEILVTMPKSKQVLLFSATMNDVIKKIASNYMVKPEEISLGEKNKGSDNVEHLYYIVHEKDRAEALQRIIDIHPEMHAIIFCRTRRDTEKVTEQLNQSNYQAEMIHGEISQNRRTRVMQRFREKKIKLLVATDVAARGIDVNELSHVINYNLPESSAAYVHRSGRTGRANNSGVSILLINMKEKHKIRALEKRVGKSFELSKLPTAQDICEYQLFNLIDNVLETEVDEEIMDTYLEAIKKKLGSMEKDELIKRFVSVEYNRFKATTSKVVESLDAGHESSQRISKADMLFARFKLNLGTDHGLDMKEIFTFIQEDPDLKGVELGNISIGKNTTIIEADQNYKDQMINSFDGLETVDGDVVKIICEQTGLRSSRPAKGNTRGGSGGRPKSGRGQGRTGGNRKSRRRSGRRY